MNKNALAQKKQLLNPPQLSSKPSIKHHPLWLSKRFFVVILMFVCYVNSALIRCNISIAVVEITYPKEIATNNSIKIQPAEFNWDSKTVGFVLSVFYYGGLFSLLGGFVVGRLGGANSCGLSLMLSGIIIILHPVSLHHGFTLFIICRLLTGMSESFLIVSVAQVCSQWIPQNEKSKLLSFVVSGINVGVGIVHGFCAFLAHQWNWQMIFYATGGIAIITALFCFIFVRNQPSEDRWISKKELAYIQDNTIRTPTKRIAHPYKSILLSTPVWALLISQFTLMWIWAILSTLLPLYVKDMIGDNIDKVGMISSFPNIVNIFMVPICGIFLDHTKNFNISVTKVHKILLSGAYLIGSILFVGMVPISNFIASVVSFVLIQMLLSISNLILQIIIISIAPNNSNVIAGLCAFVSALGGIVARSATGFMTMNHSLEEWNRCFILASGICFVGGIIFLLYGSSEAQSWSESSAITDKRNDSECNRAEKM